VNTPTSTPAFDTDTAGYITCDIHDGEFYCADIAQLIRDGEDANYIRQNSDVMVPIFPKNDIWAQVRIGAKEYGPAAYMTMEYIPDYGTTKTVNLGLWNVGEGRWSIRSVIIDFISSRVDPMEVLDNEDFRIRTRCPSNTHNFRAQTRVEQNTSRSWKWVCLWNIVMEGACTPCVELAAGDGGTSSIPDVNSNFRLPGKS